VLTLEQTEDSYIGRHMVLVDNNMPVKIEYLTHRDAPLPRPRAQNCAMAVSQSPITRRYVAVTLP
jgi:hypothetical protein